MISVEELSKLYLEAYPDDLYNLHREMTADLEHRLEESLKAVFPDQFLNYYLYLKNRKREGLVGDGSTKFFKEVKTIRL